MKNKNKFKRIGIDARFYGPVGKGLGRYTQEIVDNIIKLDNENEYVIFLRQENFNAFNSANKKVKKVLAEVRWYSLAEQIKMPLIIFKERLDLIHFPHFNVPVFCPVKFIVTVHDLILTKFPTQRATTLGPMLYKMKNMAYKAVIWLAVRRAKKVLAVSEYTRKDIIRQFKVNPEKVITTYEGVANLAKERDTLFTEKLDDNKTLLGYNINSPYLLYVGNAYPHKNLEGLIGVLPEILRNNNKINLVLVGKDDYFYNRVKKYAADLGLWKEGSSMGPVKFPGYVPDDKLEILFKNARAYVFPSMFEGFGLPPLEAMAKGCPVASSDKTCLPEVLGEAAIYFNPDDKEDMKNKIIRVISSDKLRDDLIKKGYEQVKKYSWWECARKTLNVYKEVLS